MYRILWLLSAVPLLVSLPAAAQKLHFSSVEPPGGCYLPPVENIMTYSRPYVFRDRVRPKALTYAINYLEDGTSLGGRACSTWPDSAKLAFEYGVSIWSDVLQGSQQIDVDACYSFDLPAGTLGSAGATNLYTLGPVFGQASVFFPKALTEELTDASIPGADIQVFINGNFADNFYYGLDAAPPPSQIDFVTLTVHEMGHGLGFAGSGRVDDGEEPPECDGIAGQGCIGLSVSTGDSTFRIPIAYDLFVDLTANGSAITDVTPNPGVDIGDALTGQGGGIRFDETNHDPFFAGSDQYPLYTPVAFRPGSSYSHFNDPAEVMYYSLSFGSANHDVGRAARVMQGIGWPEAVAAALPVELLSFTGHPEEHGVALDWSTARERNNEAFEVEVSRAGQPFDRIAVLDGRGTIDARSSYAFLDDRPAAGTNLYRLRQLDHDGRVTYSDVISVRFAVAAPVVGEVYPNPGRGEWVYLAYRSDRPRVVSATLHDTAGRRLRHREVTLPSGLSGLPVNVGDLPRGLYFLKFADGEQAVVRRVLVE